jgi:nucleoside-diphosphate-sugar epimerase
MKATREPELEYQNRDNIHVKRLTRAVVLLTHAAEVHVGGETEEKFREVAEELRKTRDVIELMFDKIDAVKST